MVWLCEAFFGEAVPAQGEERLPRSLRSLAVTRLDSVWLCEAHIGEAVLAQGEREIAALSVTYQ
jgi:hypothetical protein